MNTTLQCFVILLALLPSKGYGQQHHSGTQSPYHNNWLITLPPGVYVQQPFKYKPFEFDSIRNGIQNEILKKHKPTDLIELGYYFDNGRGSENHQIWIWKDGSIERFIAIWGLENTKRVDTISSFRFIDTYVENNLTIEEHYLDSAASHEYGYSISILINSKSKPAYIRDSRRGINHYDRFSNEELQKFKEEAEKDNPLVKWVNDIDAFFLALVQGK